MFLNQTAYQLVQITRRRIARQTMLVHRTAITDKLYPYSISHCNLNKLTRVLNNFNKDSELSFSDHVHACNDNEFYGNMSQKCREDNISLCQRKLLTREYNIKLCLRKLLTREDNIKLYLRKLLTLEENINISIGTLSL